jgi:tripeptide aminopeptidase
MMKLPANIVNDLLELAITLQSIPAPTFHEQQRAVFFMQHLTEIGLADVHIDTTGNVMGRLPGKNGARPLVISAHMDTVYPFETPLTVQRKDDRLIGPGIGDNAMGLAAIVTLVTLLKQQQAELPGDLWVVVNVCEEGLGDLRGMQAVVNHFGSLPLAYLVVEGMGLGSVLHRGLGVERYKILVETPGGHSWADYGRPSAIHELSTIITRLTAIQIPREPCTTLNVGVVSGGTTVNTIAANAWLELDLRSEDRYVLAKLARDVHAIVISAQRTGVQVKIERIGKRLAGHLPVNHPLVVLARDVLKELELDAVLEIASTDANLPLSRGLPAICIGITNGNKAHSLDEYILTDPVEKGLKQLYMLVTRAWGKLE